MCGTCDGLGASKADVNQKHPLPTTTSLPMQLHHNVPTFLAKAVLTPNLCKQVTRRVATLGAGPQGLGPDPAPPLPIVVQCRKKAQHPTSVVGLQG